MTDTDEGKAALEAAGRAVMAALAFASIEPLFPGGLPAWWTYL